MYMISKASQILGNNSVKSTAYTLDIEGCC